MGSQSRCAFRLLAAVTTGLWVGLAFGGLAAIADSADRVGPCPDNPHYLAWGDTPIFPLGATTYHSWTPISRPNEVDFIAQMDRLAAVIADIASPHVCGFVRCLPYDPMNHMHDGEVQTVLQPWVRGEDGRYDLERFAPEWEARLRAYLTAALERRIVVAVEVWDDWSVTRGPEGAYDPGAGYGWNAHPFNPRNNVNYDGSVLPEETAVRNAPFYQTVPARDNNGAVLALQKRYVDHLVGIVGDYPHVLINIANESRAHLDWTRFWAEYIRGIAPEGTMIGDMPSTNRRDGGGESEDAFSPLTLSADRRYDFVDIAQAVSGHEFGESERQAIAGGERIVAYRRAMAEADTRRPLIISKDYTRSPSGGDMVLWSRFIGGAASARFHRLAHDHPPSVSQFQHDAVGRLGRFIAGVPFWRMAPAPERVRALPEGDGANVLADPDSHWVVQLVGVAEGGTLGLAMPAGAWSVRWGDPATGRDLGREEVTADGDGLSLKIPAGPGHRVAQLERKAP